MYEEFGIERDMICQTSIRSSPRTRMTLHSNQIAKELSFLEIAQIQTREQRVQYVTLRRLER